MDIYLIEAVKNMPYVFGRHTDSGVRHLQADCGFSIFRARRQMHADLSVLGSELKGIRQQVIHNPLQFLGIRCHRKIRIGICINLEMDVFPERQGPESISHSSKEACRSN